MLTALSLLSLFFACSAQKEAEAPHAASLELVDERPTTKPLSALTEQTLQPDSADEAQRQPEVDDKLAAEKDQRNDYYVLRAAGKQQGEVAIAHANQTAHDGDETLIADGIEIRLVDRDAADQTSQLDILSNSPEAQEYTAALAQLEATNFQIARDQLKSFQRAHPQHWLAGSALYWQGIAERALGELSAAQETLSKMLQLYEDSTRRSDAQLELAHIYYSQGNEDEARRLYHLTLRNFPKTPAARAVPTEYLSSFEK